jgi:hypothetical protein
LQRGQLAGGCCFLSSNFLAKGRVVCQEQQVQPPTSMLDLISCIEETEIHFSAYNL